MKNEKECFFPLTKEPCSDKCAWADIRYIITDDGVDRDVFCAVGVIAGWCLSQGGEIDEFLE